MDEKEKTEKKGCLIPGDIIGTEEEVLAGRGAYVDNGAVRASLVGEYRLLNRYATVSNPREALSLTKGVTVVGIVESLTDVSAMVRITPIEHVLGKPKTVQKGRFPNVKLLSNLHISNISRGYVPNIRDAIRVGDIIKATVINLDIKRNMIDISTTSPRYGVVFAHCSRCGAQMVRRGNVLKCPKCNHVEKRKLSNDYGRL